ncbi:MAG: hypothetical protein NC218_11590 [Acetobacter sp.]|nr:hypothetical protein [Acetobacter sp.]
MSRKTSFMIFIAAVVIIMASFVAGFSPITREVSKVFTQMCGLYLSLAAVITSLLLSKQKHYWLIMLGIAVIASILIQLLIVGGSLMTVALLYKIIAFIVYVYLVQLMRYMI